MYGKIVNNQLVLATKQIKTETGWITNPTDEMLIANGYKEIVYSEKPQYDIENEALAEKYIEQENQILVDYDIEMLNDYAHNEIIKKEIRVEEAKLTSRNYREAIKDILSGQTDTYAINKITEIENNIVALRAKLRIDPLDATNGSEK